MPPATASKRRDRRDEAFTGTRITMPDNPRPRANANRFGGLQPISDGRSRQRHGKAVTLMRYLSEMVYELTFIAGPSYLLVPAPVCRAMGSAMTQRKIPTAILISGRGLKHDEPG